MKLKFLVIVLATLVAASAMGQQPVSSKIVHGPVFQELIVTGPVKVELIESENTSVEAVGNYDFINAISITWLKNKLHIVYFQNEKSTDPVVKVYGKNLKTIVIEEGARVTTPGALKSETLFVNVIGESAARISNHGKIRIVNPEGVNIQRVTGKE